MKLVIAALVVAGLAISVIVQWHQLDRLHAENAALRQQAGDLAALQAQERQPLSAPPVTEESARQQREHRELLRLRGEVALLRNRLEQALAPEGAGRNLAAPAQQATNDQAVPLQCTAKATAIVHTGESFATGGWLTAPGTRTFFLATPKVGPEDSGVRMIEISTTLMKMPEGDLPETLLQKLASQTDGASLVLVGGELDVLMAALKSGQESNVLSRPRIITGDDAEASLMVGETSSLLTNPDGSPRFIGTELHLLPRLKDGGLIEVGVNLKYDVPSAAATGDPASPDQ
jgi:hypothetical protein